MLKPFYILLFLLICGINSNGQTTLEQIVNMQSTPKVYTTTKAKGNIHIDGLDSEKDWENAPWSDEFTDIEGELKSKPTYSTRFKMLWDSEHLYLYAKILEPHVWGQLTEHDAIIYHDNDFEVFIKPSEYQSLYYEIEVNALNTIMDLMMPKPYRLGGAAIMHWDVKQLKSAVHIEGTLNNPDDLDQYWAVEMAIPLKSLSMFGKNPIPTPNDYWRINFSRVQWQHSIQEGKYGRKKKNDRLIAEENWVWSPIGKIDMHYPERWGYIHFVDELQNSPLPPSFVIEQTAWNIFYLQQLNFNSKKHYSDKLEILQGYDKILKNKMRNINFSIVLNKNKNFYKVELFDNLNKTKATIDSFGNYNLAYE